MGREGHEMMTVFFYGVLVILLGSIAAFCVPEKYKGRVLASCTAAGALLAAVPAAVVLLTGSSMLQAVLLPFPFDVVHVKLDSLSAFFVLIIAPVCVGGTIYA